jgi:hypothetical protein
MAASAVTFPKLDRLTYGLRPQPWVAYEKGKTTKTTTISIRRISMKPKHRWYMPIVNNATHVFVASVLFCIVALPALGLSFLVKWMEAMAMPQYSLTCLTFLENVIVTVDVVGVLLYIFSKLYEHVKGCSDDDESEGT